jgi:iron-sulfur cluster repair protein YtfE (RIC family)
VRDVCPGDGPGKPIPVRVGAGLAPPSGQGGRPDANKKGLKKKMSTDVLTRLSDEHDTLLPIIVEIQAAAEVQDKAVLIAKLVAGRAALTGELDEHITLEEDVAFPIIGQAVGEEIVTPFRTEHTEIRGLRDAILAQADSGSAPFNLCLQLCDLIQSHMQREDMMLFPSARDALDTEALEML